jgi:hypothetical protein
MKEERRESSVSAKGMGKVKQGDRSWLGQLGSWMTPIIIAVTRRGTSQVRVWTRVIEANKCVHVQQNERVDNKGDQRMTTKILIRVERGSEVPLGEKGMPRGCV